MAPFSTFSSSRDLRQLLAALVLPAAPLALLRLQALCRGGLAELFRGAQGARPRAGGNKKRSAPREKMVTYPRKTHEKMEETCDLHVKHGDSTGENGDFTGGNDDEAICNQQRCCIGHLGVIHDD